MLKLSEAQSPHVSAGVLKSALLTKIKMIIHHTRIRCDILHGEHS